MLNVFTINNSKINKEGRRKPWQLIGMVMALMVVIVSQMYTYPQMTKLYILNTYSFLCPSYLNKVVLKKKLFGALRPPYKGAGVASWRRSVPTQRTKVPRH